MRRLSLLLAVLAAASADADRLIDIPIARKVPIGEFRFEAQFGTAHSGMERDFFATGINQNFDIELRSERFSPEDRVYTADIGFNLQPPITDISPGISVGVQDSANTTRDGRRFYTCITYRQGLQTSAANAFMDTTVGVRVGRRTYPFVGVDLPFCDRVHLLAEDNGQRISVGPELKFPQGVNLRVIFQQQRRMLFGVQFSHRFRS